VLPQPDNTRVASVIRIRTMRCGQTDNELKFWRKEVEGRNFEEVILFEAGCSIHA